MLDLQRPSLLNMQENVWLPTQPELHKRCHRLLGRDAKITVFNH